MAGPSLPPSQLSTEIAGILRARIARRQLSVTSLAKTVGISYPQLRRYLGGERVMDLEELDLLCEALEITIVDVIREADEEAEMRHEDESHLNAARPIDVDRGDVFGEESGPEA